MFQTQEKHIDIIRTSVLIEQVQCIGKNYQQKKFETQKSNHIILTQINPKREWTTKEENLMFQLHNQYGNKWAIIAEQLKERQFCANERSDNSVKNHFYSRLRKGLRKLNKFIALQLKKTFKQFKLIDLYKVLEASYQKFKEIKAQQCQFADFGVDLKNRFFLFAEEETDSTEEGKIRIRKFLDDLSSFTKDYRRKSKKNRRYSPMGADSVYRTHIKGQIQQGQSNEEAMISESSLHYQNLQRSKVSMVQLRKNSFKSNQKQFDQKDQRTYVKQQKKSQRNLRKIQKVQKQGVRNCILTFQKTKNKQRTNRKNCVSKGWIISHRTYLKHSKVTSVQRVFRVMHWEMKFFNEL